MATHFSDGVYLEENRGIILEKAFEPQRRKEREGKSISYQTIVYYPIGSGLYLHKY
jgi:hypothetical protein